MAEVAVQRGGSLLVAGMGEGPVSRWLAAAASGAALVAVGETGGAPVGLAAARVAATPRGLLGVVEAIYVEEQARQVGVGEAMLDLVADWCRTRGCVGIDAPALPGSRAAKAFFEGAGFVTRQLIMHRSLGSGPVD